MNIYVVVEGNSSEPKVYRKWIPLVNPDLKEVSYIQDVNENNFLIRTGGGYPNLVGIIQNALEDIRNNPIFNRLVVVVDSEDLTLQQRHAEIEQHIQANQPICQYKIVVQHFCLEAWGLGNRKFGPRKPKSEELREYKLIHDVFENDPENLPGHKTLELNRAQFAEKYLRSMIRDKGNHLTYTKSRPDVVAHESYFSELKSRLAQTGHIASFNLLFDAFA